MTSLVQPLTDFSIRQTGDKDMEVSDLGDCFDQYVETDFLQFSDTTADPSGSNDFAAVFDLPPPSNGNDPFETSSIPNWDASTEDAWHAALQSLDQNPASPSMPSSSFSVYPESRGKASFSNPELFSFDEVFEFHQAEPRLSLSAPSTPKPHAATPPKKPISNSDRSITSKIQKSAKKLSTFSKMMRPSHFRAGVQDLWTRKMVSAADAFNLQLPPNNLPNSPPASTKLMQDENSNGFFPREQPYTIAMSSLPGDETPELQQSHYQITPLSSPAIDINSRNGATGNSFQFSNENMATAYISHHISNAALSALHTPPPTNRLPMTAWGSETPANLHFSFSASPDYQALNAGGKAQGWWTDAPNTSPVDQPSTSTYHPAQSRTPSNAMNFSTASVAGLGITCDTAPFSSYGPELENTNGHGTSTNGFSASASSFEIPYEHQNSSIMYPPTPSVGIHIGQPRTPSRTNSRSPSRSPTPQPRFTRRRHSSQPHHKHNSSISTSSHSRTHRRKSSNSLSQSQKQGSGVGFVNFTPDDSRKILTGVAPSGSSKTKARREKEAAERRRKLSLAAVKAVMEAGGDLRPLEEGGLLSLGGME